MEVNVLKKIIKLIISIIAIAGVICLLVGIAYGEFSIAGYSILGVAVVLWINYALSTYFYHVATEKGYYESCYLWIPFLFSAIGYILVAALPDRGNGTKNVSIPTKASVNLSNGNTSNENRIASEPININKTKNNTKKHKKENDISKDSFDKEECDEEEYIDINCPDCNEKLSFRKDESAMICPNCYKIIYSATHNLENDISALNADWEKDISALDTETVYQRYRGESEWSEEYRYLCYKELEKRSANRSK